jgi:hypothetical protein
MATVAPVSYSNFVTVVLKEKFTTRDIVDLIHLLEKPGVFSVPYKFYPEPITEGGLVLDWPDRTDGQYKSLRFYFNGHWPVINCTTRWDWEDSPPITLRDKEEFGTFIKAFHGAPCWTKDELTAVKKCLLKLPCVKTVKGRIPGKKSTSYMCSQNGLPSTHNPSREIFEEAARRRAESSKRSATTTIAEQLPHKTRKHV